MPFALAWLIIIKWDVNTVSSIAFGANWEIMVYLPGGTNPLKMTYPIIALRIVVIVLCDYGQVNMVLQSWINKSFDGHKIFWMRVEGRAIFAGDFFGIRRVMATTN